MERSEFLVYRELYKRGEYGLIPIAEAPDGSYYYPTDKQMETLQLLNDHITTMLGYGGSARSGKSIIECIAMIFECDLYEDIAWGLARRELTTLRKTVLLTLFKQLKFYGFVAVKGDVKENHHYNYNDKLNKITFNNISDIFLIDTKYQPQADPLNTRFGGFELTRCAVDESNETKQSVILKLYERTGWRNNDKHDLKRKLFECFNPAKNHVYSRYYKPYRDKTEPPHKKFIPALPGDNPHPSVKEWVEDMMVTGDTTTIQRQILGNFEYDDDPSTLTDYDAICDIFTNDHVQGGKQRISADLAMQGRDRYVAGHWDGLICTVAIDEKKSTGRGIELSLKELKIRKKVGNSDIIADSDGLGNYLESYIRNITSFRGGQPAIDKDVYANIKSECGWMLAELINQRCIRVICTEEQEEAIKEELSICLKQDNLHADTQKKRLISKQEQKENLGHSPDYFDMLLMGMLPIIKDKQPTVFRSTDISIFSMLDLMKMEEVAKGDNGGSITIQAIITTIKNNTSHYSLVLGKKIDKLIYITDIIYTDKELMKAEEMAQYCINPLEFDRLYYNGDKTTLHYKKRLKTDNPNKVIYGVSNHLNKLINIRQQHTFISKYFRFRKDYRTEPQYNEFMEHVLTYSYEGINKECESAPFALSQLARLIQKEFKVGI